VLTLAGVLVVAVACSDPDATPASSPSRTVASSPATTAGSSVPGSAPVTVQPTTTATANDAALEAEAGGWRLALFEPTAGATVGPRTNLCYEVAGASREPEVVLEVTLLAEGSTNGVLTVLADGSVGRGSVQVDLGRSPRGRYDVRVQLIINGAAVDGVAVTIPGVTVSDAAPPEGCH